MRNIAIIVFLIVSGSYFVAIPQAEADTLTVSPIIIDKKGKIRDYFGEKITLKNTGREKLFLYASVNNLNPEEGMEEFLHLDKVDLSSSLANWIEITRGVIELMPGEEKEVDLGITINLRAKPGIYHAIVSFADGTTKDSARGLANKVLINVEVVDDSQERLAIKKFGPARNVFLKAPVVLNYALENSGDRATMPTGKIFIYDRSGEEVTTLDINEADLALEPGGAKQFASAWHTLDFGKYKAILQLRYGADQDQVVQDTIFFQIVPWPLIIGASVLTLGAILVLIFLILRTHAHKH